MWYGLGRCVVVRCGVMLYGVALCGWCKGLCGIGGPSAGGLRGKNALQPGCRLSASTLAQSLVKCLVTPLFSHSCVLDFSPNT